MTIANLTAVDELDPLGDQDRERDAGRKNRAKVGSSRPSTLLYTYGPGAVMDLPQFTVMPAGLDDWERIWKRRDSVPEIRAPRLRSAVRTLLRSPDLQLRPFPRQATRTSFSSEGDDLGVPARVFPQWLRCTGCDLLAGLMQYDYRNTHPFRPDLAGFVHVGCPGRSTGRHKKATKQSAVPARYLLACPRGHLDEFPYDWWVHHGQRCGGGAVFPSLKMVDSTAGKGASARIECASCGLRRGLNEAQGEVGRTKLPRCRGRHPHLDAYDENECREEVRLMLIGASNLWFAATQSIVVMPDTVQERAEDLSDRILVALPADRMRRYQDDAETLRDVLDGKVDVTALTDEDLLGAVAAALAPPEPENVLEERRLAWDPVDLLVPEWEHLQRDPLDRSHDEDSGLTLSRRPCARSVRAQHVSRVLAVEKLRKVNALLGFTRIDDFDRVGDASERLAPLARADRLPWTVATEDRGEGVYLQLDEGAVAAWEARVLGSATWEALRAAHERNFERRFSETADRKVSADDRFKPPRYWLVHTFAHVLIRELAMTCGYSAASLSERLYAWEGAGDRPAAAGLLISTTASDSDGTLGGLVQLSEEHRLEAVVHRALGRAGRCSSDPICAHRTPKEPEDFLHGAACHCCVMASETSCERANRFLDRRFLVPLPDSDLAFFGPADRR